MPQKIDEEIDRLYQLPPEEFTAARNTLAKEAGPEAAARIRKLSKPPLAVWAINQLFWKDRDTYDDLIQAAETARATHKTVLSGRKGDIRSANAEHDKAVDRASKAALEILADSGHPVTDATRHAVLQTIRALPGDEPPGRLTKPLQPGGFEMLAGITQVPGERGQGSGGIRKEVSDKREAPAASKRSRTKAEEAASARQAREQAARRAKEEKAEKLAAKRAREAKAAAERAVRAAEQEARRGEFEVARAEREAQRAQTRLAEQQRELEAARARLEAARQALARL